jgi:hypothetical protein
MVVMTLTLSLLRNYGGIMHDLLSIKEFLRTYHTPEELVNLLEISTDDLLEHFEENIEENMHKFAQEDTQDD